MELCDGISSEFKHYWENNFTSFLKLNETLASYIIDASYLRTNMLRHEIVRYDMTCISIVFINNLPSILALSKLYKCSLNEHQFYTKAPNNIWKQT